MEKFNNTTLFTGYLKQLLRNYNLPKYKVYTRAQEDYFDKYGVEREDVFKTFTKYSAPIDDIWYPNNLHYIPYIRGGKIQEYVDGKWIDISGKNIKNGYTTQYYEEGLKVLNYTKNLKITTNSYDSYTHEYLGDYLRFQRDFNNLDLMPLYNCFSDKVCDKLDYSWKIFSTSTETGGLEYHEQSVVFNTNDTNYKIYMLPVKLFKSYTIAIDSSLPIEICCGMYGAFQDTREKFITIPKLTYQKFCQCQFSSPILYSKLGLSPKAIDPAAELPEDAECALNTFGQSLLDEICQIEENLKLFIKVPTTNNSTIVVLEGDYRNWNDRIMTILENSIETKTNSTVLNFEKLPKDIPFSLITPLQLLSFNTKEQHPFADRLIEYLLGNVITPLDEVNKDITRVQKVLINNTLSNAGKDPKTGKYIGYQYNYVNKGFWDNYIRYVIYDYMKTHQNTFGINHDLLGYVDKDAEKYYYYYDKLNDTNVSISNVEVDEEEKL